MTARAANRQRQRASTGGVRERRTRRGVVFALRYRVDVEREGVVVRERFFETLGGDWEGWSRARAEQHLADQLDRLRLGVWKPPRAQERPVEAGRDEPSFHLLASEYVERRRREVDERSVEGWLWALRHHLLPFFDELRPSEITPRLVKQYTAAKQEERQEREAAIERWRRSDPRTRGRMPRRGLSNASINATLKVLGQVLDEALEEGWVETNVARGKKRRLKAEKPRRTWLELHEVQTLLSVAGEHRALLAAMVLTGLRVSELTSLRWRDVDLAGGKLRVVTSKTEAGERVVDLTPDLREELAVYRADAVFAAPDDLVFATSRGTKRNRSNLTRQILHPAIARANVALGQAGRPRIEGVTNHSLRRTFCALLFEAGASPAYVMAQMGHTDAGLALAVYAKVMERRRDTGARMDALLRDDYRVLAGTETSDTGETVSLAEDENPAGAGLS